RFGERLKAINAGIERDGAYYLFTLRLVPVFPYFIINLLMGLTPIKIPTYYMATQAGMLAANLVFVNAGTQLAKIDSLSGILSPGVIGSLLLLGLFPLAMRKIVTALAAKNVRTYIYIGHLQAISG
ncbi:MAG: TVP38/TMEM64 family protein, partial [Deltaproteobacteria bacterium]|nr:TVP38/TMEM64 family protein [Deltaproteobacteria bacterium]